MFFQELPEPHREIFSLVGRVADELGMDAYVVGGYVRDFYLGRLQSGAQGRAPDEAPVMDIDFVTVGSGIRLATGVAEALEKLYGKEIHLAVFKRFGTAQIQTRPAPRAESSFSLCAASVFDCLAQYRCLRPGARC